MTDQLSDAELELAVAKVMGLDVEYSAYAVWRKPRAPLDVRLPHAKTEEFAPLTNPAQRMEVQDWARARGYVIHIFTSIQGKGSVCSLCTQDYEHRGIGPDDAHALLRAVVEMGDD